MKTLRSLLIVTTLVGANAQSVLACACCADHGQREKYTIERDHYMLSDIEWLTEYGPASFVTGPCGVECVEGITNPLFDYDVTLKVTGTQLHLILRDKAGAERGKLTFQIPPKGEYFALDTDPAMDRGEPILFTEFRFKGTLTGEGDFAMYDSTVPAELILAGRANNCPDAGSLETWSIEVQALKVWFRLVGRLAVG